MRPIVAVIHAEVTAPVTLAQTPPLLAAWRAAGRATDAAVITSPRALLFPADRRAHRNALAKLAAASGRAPWTKTHTPRERSWDRLGRGLGESLGGRGLLSSVLFCRQPRAALIALAARTSLGDAGSDLRVVLDLRGIRDDEYLLSVGRTEQQLTKPERALLDEYRTQERDACRGSDFVLTVSRPMSRIVTQRWGIDDSKLGHVPNHAPAVPDAERLRTEVRRELGFADDAVVFVYSGTLAAWQLPDRSAALVRAFRLHHPQARMLFLTPDVAAARTAAVQGGVPDAVVRSVPSGDVARFLCAADYGLLLRQELTVNRAACPVKFGEYLAAGVRVVLTPNIGDQSAAALDANLGAVVGLVDVVQSAKQLDLDCRRPLSIDLAGRERRRAWAAEHVSAAGCAARIAQFLDRL